MSLKDRSVSSMYLAANSMRRRTTKAWGERPNVPRKEREKCASLRHTRARRWARPVAVVGLTGIGSMVSMQFAHWGIGALLLLDGDLCSRMSIGTSHV